MARRAAVRHEDARVGLAETPDSSASTDAIAAYGEYIASELADKRAADESLERRGWRVVTTSGALLTVIFGLVSLAARGEGFAISEDAKAFLYLALLALVVAVASGLASSFPIPLRSVQAGSLRSAVAESGKQTGFVSQVSVAKTQLRAVESYVARLRWKARLVAIAIIAEFVAIASLAAVVAHLVSAL